MESDQSESNCNWRSTAKVFGYIWIVKAIIGYSYIKFHNFSSPSDLVMCGEITKADSLKREF